MSRLLAFSDAQLATVEAISEEARALVSDYYTLAPREWAQMPSEVRTLAELAPAEITDHALAQVLCYEYTRSAGNEVIDQGELYRICLQDHRILTALKAPPVPFDFAALLLYVMTHEFVHVVRFGVKLQQLDLPEPLRPQEERNVDGITRKILEPLASPAVHRVVARFG